MRLLLRKVSLDHLGVCVARVSLLLQAALYSREILLDPAGFADLFMRGCSERQTLAERASPQTQVWILPYRDAEMRTAN